MLAGVTLLADTRRRLGGKELRVHRAVPRAPPEPVRDERNESQRPHEQEPAGVAMAPEEVDRALADEATDGHPERRVEQRADDVEGEEAPVGDVATPRHRGGKQAHPGRRAGQQDRALPQPPELAPRLPDPAPRAPGDAG